MEKYLRLLKFELKTIYRDGFQLYLLLFPILMLLLGIFVFPLAFRAFQEDEVLIRYSVLFILLVLMSFGTYLLGAMGSFLLLENKDEKTINSISVTPLGMNGYLWFKIVYLYVLAIGSIFVILFGIKMFASNLYAINGVRLLDRLGFWDVVVYTLVAALFAPALALFQAGFSKNKVEGFALMKISSLTAMVPLVMVLDTFKGGLQYVLGIFPNFWSLKALLLVLNPTLNDANLPQYVYYLVGVLYTITVLIVCRELFRRKLSS